MGRNCVVEIARILALFVNQEGQTRLIHTQNVDDNLNECSAKGLAFALHARQDTASRSHSDFPDYDENEFKGAQRIRHFMGDLIPTPSEHLDAIQKTMDTIEEFRKKCPCFCVQ